MKKKIVFYIFLSLILSCTPVYAHKMLIVPVEEGTIQVVYEDGSFSTRTVVYVYDEEGNEIDQGRLDAEGNFYYDATIAYSFVADDGIGHRTEWTIGEEAVATSDPHRWLTVGAVVAVFVAIAVIFSLKAKRKNKSN